jgi:hypothetical protein
MTRVAASSIIKIQRRKRKKTRMMFQASAHQAIPHLYQPKSKFKKRKKWLKSLKLENSEIKELRTILVLGVRNHTPVSL